MAVAENISSTIEYYSQLSDNESQMKHRNARKTTFVADAAQAYICKKAESTHHVCRMEPVENWHNWPQGPYQSVEIG